nr:GAF domain-containing protein [Mycolicibacterium chubuense]
MHQQLEELVADREQMGELLRVAIEISSDLDLDATLVRIVNAAMSVTSARYGAIGVWRPDGTLSSFVHEGLDEETARRIGHLPAGKGLLGVLQDRDEPLRLRDLTEDPRAVGFPEHHPVMRAFLGMPIMIRGAVYGALFVADDRPDQCFTASDEVTIRALGSAASVAIDNARLFELTRASARWTDASRAITAALLSEDTPQRPLNLIVQRAMELTGAEQGIVLVPVEPNEPGGEVDTLVVSAAVGVHADAVLGQLIPVDGSTSGEVFRSGRPVITETFRRPIQAFTDVGERPAIVMPLRADDETLGVIAVARNAAQSPFDAGYLDLVSDFAAHAAVALTLAAARSESQQLSVLADRERIARDMHDQVIQRVFAVGLDLQGTVGRVRAPEIAQRITHCIDDLQAVIDDMRLTIFDLHHCDTHRRTFSQRLQEAVGRITENRRVATTVRMSGPVNVVSGDLADDAEAVVLEALSNAVRHSGANTITIDVAVDDDLTIEISDDGCGIPADNDRHSGLSNMALRADAHGGRCTLSSPESGGTTVSWTCPLPVGDDEESPTGRH